MIELQLYYPAYAGPSAVNPARYTALRFSVEITEPERIVIRHPDPAHDFQLIVTLAEEDAKATRLTWCQVFSSREHFEQEVVYRGGKRTSDGSPQAEMAGIA